MLDLFAGTGAIGFEAASRGAARVVSVEAQREIAHGDRRSRQRYGRRRRRLTVFPAPAERALYRLEGPFDIVYLDPPYADPGPAPGLPPVARAQVIGPRRAGRLRASGQANLAADTRVSLGSRRSLRRCRARLPFTGKLNNGKLERVTRAIYPGSFDPPTNGHLDVIERAARCFGELIVAVVVNPQKRAPMFSLAERESMLRESCARLSQRASRAFSRSLSRLRQIRESRRDRKGSARRLRFRERDVGGDDEPVALRRRHAFLMSDQRYSFVSSSLVKEVFFLGGDVAALVPKPVLAVMAAKRPTCNGGSNVGLSRP